MEIKHVSGDRLDAMRVLADGLARALELAGLPADVDLSGDVEQRAGAVIEVDTVDDDGGGVFVAWQASYELLEESSSARPQGRSASHGDGLRPPLPPDTDEQEGCLSDRLPSSGRGRMWGRMRPPTTRTTTTNQGPDPL